MSALRDVVSTTYPTTMSNNSSYTPTTSSPTYMTTRNGETGTDILQTTMDFLASTPATTSSPQERQLSVAYTASEAIVSLLAVFGNALVAYVFCKNRSLRRYRNYYIFALAIADFLVGLFGIPLAVLASVGIPKNLYGCLFTVSLLMVLCTISILCLVAVSIDRYWATTNPFAYYRHMTTSTAVGIILSCWIVGAVIGFLPLFGWYNLDGWNQSQNCYFTDVIDYNYLVFLYFATIVFPAILMAGFYGYIYHVVLIKIRQKGNLAPQIRRPSEQSRTGSLNSDQRGASQIARMIVSEKRREAKAAHKLGIIVLFFMICWMPLYTINCIQAFCPKCNVPIELLQFTIILSHANSSLNPLLYAYHLKEFRIAMKNALLLLFEKILCGLIKTREPKHISGVGGLSRSQTIPSLANAAIIANSAGISMKFRRSPKPGEESRSVQISPNRGDLILASVSRNNLHQNAGTDKSLTSLSMASDTSGPILLEIPQQIIKSNNETSPNKVGFSSLLKRSDSMENMESSQHGEIEIHVVNINTESRMNGKVKQIHRQFPEEANNQNQPEVTNNIEMEPNRVSINELTTPM